MPLCQFIHNEIQKIAGTKVDLTKLDPREYGELLERLPKEIKKLNILKNVLELNSKNIFRIEQIIENNTLENENKTSIYYVIATSLEEISENTIIYFGDINFSEYALHKNIEMNFVPTELPKGIREIYGTLETGNTTLLAYIDVDYVSKDMYLQSWVSLTMAKVGSVGGNASFRRCFELKSAIIGDVGIRADFFDCENLGKLTIGDVGTDLFFDNCKAITLNNISSAYGQHIKIKVGNKLRVKNSGLANCTDQELLEKFDVKTENIIRN